MKKLITRLALFSCGLGLAQSPYAQTGDAQTSVTNLVISAKQPLAVAEKNLRQAMATYCQEMLDAPAGKFAAHPSAAAFPGPAAATTPRISKIIAFRHTPISAEMRRFITPLNFSSPFKETLHSTGLYTAPGEVVSVTVPANLIGKVFVQIGCHTDGLNRWVAAKEAWRRAPLITNRRPLDQVKTEISNPFGGLIFLAVSPTAEACAGDVTIANAVMSPLYVKGQTTDAQWQEMLAATGAPWGEMATENVIIMLPVTALKTVNDPAQRMEIWDSVIGTIMDLAQLPMPFYRAQRLVTDVHIGGGFMHSGYPIMVHHCPEVGMVSEDSLADPRQFFRAAKGGPNWGFFHEIGHNMQNNDWVFDGTTEVSVNFFSLYCFDKLTGGRDEAHSGISNAKTQRMLKDYFSKPADFRKWKSDPFLGLLTFRMIQNDFGWELFKETFRRYHKLDDKDRPKTDQQKRDLLVRNFSEVAKRNFAPYFTAWGITLSDKVEADLQQYPEWMPYNFPPKAFAP